MFRVDIKTGVGGVHLDMGLPGLLDVPLVADEKRANANLPQAGWQFKAGDVGAFECFIANFG